MRVKAVLSPETRQSFQTLGMDVQLELAPLDELCGSHEQRKKMARGKKPRDCPKEAKEQETLMRWWASWAPAGYEPLLFAIPNGGWRHKATAVAMKKQGVRPGVPDLFLAYPAKGFHDLWLEMKKFRGGTVSAEQKHMHKIFKASGYAVKVCHGWLEASETIRGYLGEEAWEPSRRK